MLSAYQANFIAHSRQLLQVQKLRLGMQLDPVTASARADARRAALMLEAESILCKPRTFEQWRHSYSAAVQASTLQRGCAGWRTWEGFSWRSA